MQVWDRVYRKVSFNAMGRRRHAVVRQRQPARASGVWAAPWLHRRSLRADNPMPIGEASCVTWDQNGLAIWTIHIGGQPIAGRWVIIDRRFRQAG